MTIDKGNAAVSPASTLALATVFIAPFAAGVLLGLNPEVAFPYLIRLLVIITGVLFVSTIIYALIPEPYSTLIKSLGRIVVAVGCLVLMSALFTMGLSEIWGISYKLHILR